MNREIKFRVWDGEEMIILENSGLQYYDFEGSYSLGFTVDAYGSFWAHEQYESPTKKASQFPIMQFTGLKDKNRVDVYEGDVLKHCVDGKLFNWKVEYVDKFSGFGIVNIGVDGFLGERLPINNIYFFEDREVIGNIYQNPELL